jgi:hypothetical protein
MCAFARVTLGVALPVMLAGKAEIVPENVTGILTPES